MGGKGRRRREKNYLAAHGGNRRLPPPPDPSSVDAIPSKLRKLMSLTGEKVSTSSTRKNNANGARNSDNTPHLGDKLEPELTSSQLDDGEDGKSVVQDPDSINEALQTNMHEKQKKKRKRKQVNDLRFNTLEGVTVSKRKERKKQRSEERKKKRKRNKEEEHVDFPVHDQVKFGDVVQAPPKLVAVPKAFKSMQDASHERLRVQAVEAYRKRKGWASRPGVRLPSTVAAMSSNE